MSESLEQQLLKEAVDTFEMFRADRDTLQKSLNSRRETISWLEIEQREEHEKLLRVHGALSVLQHLVTKFKQMIDGEEIPTEGGEQK